jgi:hypothetical protein
MRAAPRVKVNTVFEAFMSSFVDVLTGLTIIRRSTGLLAFKALEGTASSVNLLQ